MRICFVSSIAIPTSRLIARQCEAMADEGLEVILVAPLKSLPGQSKVVLLPYAPAGSHLQTLGRTFAALSLALRAQADVYHVVGYQLLPCAWLLKAIFGKRVVYDMYEDFPSMASSSNVVPRCLRGATARMVQWMEAHACLHLDGIVSADPAVLRSYACELRAHSSALCRVFYNFPADWFYREAAQGTTQHKSYDIVYCGGISRRTGMHVLFEAVESIVQTGLRPKVLIAGYADSEQFIDELKIATRQRGMADCFDFRGRIAPREVPLLLRRARVGVAPLQATPKFMKNIPTKIFEYWACGLPVVASDLPPARLFAREGEFGHLSTAGDSKAMARAIVNLLLDPLEATHMGRSAQRAVSRRMNARSEQARLLRLYTAICRERAVTADACDKANTDAGVVVCEV